MDEDQRPKRKTVHEIGQALDELSVYELGERVALLQAEIGRLQAATLRKQQALDVAGSVFGQRQN